jgi:hypothetical protein
MSDTIEHAVSELTDATTLLTSAHTTSKATLDAAILTFAATTNTVNTQLNNVDNTSDANKPISTAAQTESDTKQDTLISGTNISTVNGSSLLSGTPLVISRAPTEIAAETYADRADLKALVGALAGDSVVVEGIGLFQFVATELEPEDDETCFTVPGIGQWLLSVPANDLLSAWALFEDAIRDELDEDENIRINTYLTTLGVI